MVTLDTLVTGQGAAAEQLATDAAQQTVGTRTVSLRAGLHALDWVPDATLKPRTYLLRLQVEDRTGIQAAQRAVVRLLGVDAGFRTLGAAPVTTSCWRCEPMRSGSRSRSSTAGPRPSRPTRTTS